MLFGFLELNKGCEEIPRHVGEASRGNYLRNLQQLVNTREGFENKESELLRDNLNFEVLDSFQPTHEIRLSFSQVLSDNKDIIE